MHSKKWSYGKERKMDAISIQLDTPSNYKKKPNLQERLSPKRNIIFHCQSMLEQCFTSRGALYVIN